MFIPSFTSFSPKSTSSSSAIPDSLAVSEDKKSSTITTAARKLLSPPTYSSADAIRRAHGIKSPIQKVRMTPNIFKRTIKGQVESENTQPMTKASEKVSTPKKLTLEEMITCMHADSHVKFECNFSGKEGKLLELVPHGDAEKEQLCQRFDRFILSGEAANSKILDQVFESCNFCNIDHLSLSNTNISEEALVFFSRKNNKLKHLDLSFSKYISIVAIEQLVNKSGQTLQRLNLAGCPLLKGKDIVDIINGCPNLEELNLGSLKITANDLIVIAGNLRTRRPQLLNTLDLHGVNITAKDLSYIKTLLPSATIYS